MRLDRRTSLLTSAAVAGLLLLASQSVKADAPGIEADGTINVPAFELPESSLLSPETRAVLKRQRESSGEWAASKESCPPMESAERADMAGIRKCQADAFYKTGFYKRTIESYSVNLRGREIGGVYTEVFTPKEGIARKNEKRVLINVHGGGFAEGSRTISHLESIPIAAVGKIKVISIDYRMAPEFVYPAATDDVVAVYRELIKTYAPKNIGIYGCSAGGVLASQAIARFQKDGLPRPGAVGMFCGAGAYYGEGDSGHIGAALLGQAPLVFPGKTKDSYFLNADPNDPLVFPLRSRQVLAKFPPSLLITATRDWVLSSVIKTHSELVNVGVEADLHVYEGLGHCFYFDADIPESSDTNNVIVRFFDRHLGTED